MAWKSIAIVVAAALLVAACDSNTTPVVASLNAATPSPATTGGESSAPSSAQPTDGTIETPRPSDGEVPIPPTANLPMPGFAAYDQVQMFGGEMRATVFTLMSCDALTGWLQAGDWRLDGDATSAIPTQPPDAEAFEVPNTRWLALSRPGELAVARLAANADASGCGATISRLSTQSISAAGAFNATTSAQAYQLACVPDSMAATVGMFLFGDDRTRAWISAEIPLVLGEQQLLDASVRIGIGADFALADLTEAVSQSLETSALEQRLPGVESYEAVEGSTGTASVTSIDPLIATVTLAGLVSASGAEQSVTAGLRCDLGGNQLTQAAVPPEVTPPPTIAPSGTLAVTIGSGPDGISESREGPQITCSIGVMGADTWFLSYDDPDGVTLFLFIPPDEDATFTFYDFSKSPPTTVDIDPARTGGNLNAVVEDGGSEVVFTADGTTADGRPVDLSASCRAIERI